MLFYRRLQGQPNNRLPRFYRQLTIITFDLMCLITNKLVSPSRFSDFQQKRLLGSNGEYKIVLIWILSRFVNPNPIGTQPSTDLAGAE